VRHWLVYRRQPLTYIKLLGYVGVFVLLACVVSGLVLTYQPLFGTRISYLWRSVHDWATIALIITVAPHIVLIVLRDAKGKRTEAIAPVWVAAKRYGAGLVALTLFFFVVTALALYAYEPPPVTTQFAADYEFWEPSNPLYGKNRPFAPSLARTRDSEPIDARLLAG
jgi:hypothetical protein